MHRPQHARNKLVYAIAFLYERHQCRYPALVICTTSKMSKDELLEGVYLVLEGHEVCNSLISSQNVSSCCSAEPRKDGSPFIGIIYRLQTDILLVFEKTCKNPQLVLHAFLRRRIIPLNSGCCLWKASFAKRK